MYGVFMLGKYRLVACALWLHAFHGNLRSMVARALYGTQGIN